MYNDLANLYTLFVIPHQNLKRLAIFSSHFEDEKAGLEIKKCIQY